MRRSASFMRPQPYGRAGWRGLDGFDAQRGSGSLGDLPDVGHVRRHHGVAAADGAFYHAYVDDIVVIGPSGQDAHPLSRLLGHRLGVTHAEQAAQASLSGTSSP